jgi:CarboxypepD_reg-like domain
MRFLLILICILASTIAASAQSRHILQVSGVVVATDSLLPVPYATVYRSSDNRGTFSDHTGYFTLPALAGDTLNFMFLGLKKSSYVIPYDTTQTHISIVQWMEQQEVMLPTVNVLPYPIPGRLRAEVLALDFPGDSYFRFDRTAASVSTYDGLRDLSADAYAEASATMIARYNGGFRSGGNLLDAASWGRFMNAIRRKN